MRPRFYVAFLSRTRVDGELPEQSLGLCKVPSCLD